MLRCVSFLFRVSFIMKLRWVLSPIFSLGLNNHSIIVCEVFHVLLCVHWIVCGESFLHPWIETQFGCGVWFSCVLEFKLQDFIERFCIYAHQSLQCAVLLLCHALLVLITFWLLCHWDSVSSSLTLPCSSNLLMSWFLPCTRDAETSVFSLSIAFSLALLLCWVGGHLSCLC